MSDKRKGTLQNKHLYAALLAGLLGVMIAVMVILNTGTVPQAFLDLTKTQEALYQTATHYGQFPRPHPSMTYPGDCYMGSATACAADRIREFDTQLQRFELYQATFVSRTLTAEVQSMTAP